MEKILLCILGASTLCTMSSLAKLHYHFVYDPKTWTEAQRYCRETYTDLVTVDNYGVVSVLNGMADVSQMGRNQDAWIGLYRNEVIWKWSLSDENFSNDTANFRNWAFGEPNSYWYRAECAHMYDNGKWNDAPCDWTYKAICSDINGSQARFVFADALMNWTQAQAYCREHHTDLARVRDMSENELIRLTKPAGLTVWFGLYKDTWKWSNGRFYLFSYWASGDPTGGMQTCTAAAFGLSGTWLDWDCKETKAFICYHDPVPSKTFVVKVTLQANAALDMTDPTAQKNLQDELKLLLENQGVMAEFKLSWKEQPDGTIFSKSLNN